jgi:hypothetical protein
MGMNGKMHLEHRLKLIFKVVVVSAVAWLMFSINAGAKAENPFEGAVKINPGTYKGQFSRSNLADGYIVRAKAGQELHVKAKFDLIPGTLRDPHNPVPCYMNINNMNRKNILSLCDSSCNDNTNAHQTGVVTIHWLSSTNKDYYIIVGENPNPVDKGYAKYTLDVSLSKRYDANSSRDAGDYMDAALNITPGKYKGYLAKTDRTKQPGPREANPHGDDLSDLYRLHLAKGQTIKVKATPELDGAVGLVLIGDAGEIKRVYPSEKGEIVDISWKAPSSQDVFVGVTTMEKARDADYYIGTGNYVYVGGPYTLDVQVTPKASPSPSNDSKKSKSTAAPLEGPRYFPLAVGNRWIYDVIEEKGNNKEKTGEAVLEIVSEEEGVYKARLTQKNAEGHVISQSTMNLSYNKGGKAGLYRSKDLVVPDRGAIGSLVENQIFINISDIKTIMVSPSEFNKSLYTAKVPAGSFEDCVETRFEFMTAKGVVWNSHDHIEHFAPNVGVVKHSWKGYGIMPGTLIGGGENGFFELTDYELKAPS